LHRCLQPVTQFGWSNAPEESSSSGSSSSSKLSQPYSCHRSKKFNKIPAHPSLQANGPSSQTSFSRPRPKTLARTPVLKETPQTPQTLQNRAFEDMAHSLQHAHPAQRAQQLQQARQGVRRALSRLAEIIEPKARDADIASHAEQQAPNSGNSGLAQASTTAVATSTAAPANVERLHLQQRMPRAARPCTDRLRAVYLADTPRDVEVLPKVAHLLQCPPRRQQQACSTTSCKEDVSSVSPLPQTRSPLNQRSPSSGPETTAKAAPEAAAAALEECCRSSPGGAVSRGKASPSGAPPAAQPRSWGETSTFQTVQSFCKQGLSRSHRSSSSRSSRSMAMTHDVAGETAQPHIRKCHTDGYRAATNYR